MGSDFRDFEKLLEGFGGKFNILETKYKPYPLCIWGHSSVDAFKKVVEENGIHWRDIESVNVKTIKKAVDFLSSSKMERIYGAQFSLPHALSMVSLGKKPGPEWMSEDNIFHNHEPSALAQKITMEVDPKADEIFNEEKGLAIPSTVEAKTKGGRRFQEHIKYSKGTPNDPFIQEELKDKFRRLSSSVFTEKRIEEIIDSVESIESLDDVSGLVKLLREND
jgi:2-methylcitrate dehydratase PrpD